MEHAPELDAVSGLDAVVLGPEAPEDAARRALRVPTLEHHVADPDAYLELYERHSWARRRGHGPPMLEGRPFFPEREGDDWQRPMAWKFRRRLLVEWCAAADGPFELLERHTAARAARVLARRATRQRVVRAALPVRPAVAVADFLCGDARAIEVRVFAEHFLLGSFLHRKLASALGLLGARVTTFCTRLSAFASTYVAARPRVDFDGVLAKNKTTLSKRACAAVLRCDKRHRY